MLSRFIELDRRLDGCLPGSEIFILRLFFMNIYRMAHNAWEAFLTKAGFSIAEMLETGKYLMPVVHAEADYKMAQAAGIFFIGVISDFANLNSIDPKYCVYSISELPDLLGI